MRLAASPSGARCQEALEAAQRGPDAIEALVHHRGLAPQVCVIGGHAQHVLGACHRAWISPTCRRRVTILFCSRSSTRRAFIGRSKPGRNSASGPSTRLNSTRSSRASSVTPPPNTSITAWLLCRPARPGNAPGNRRRALPSGGTGGMKPDNAEGDGQALATLDDADQVGVGEIVVVFRIAGVSVATGDQARERFGAHRQVIGADHAASSTASRARADRCRAPHASRRPAHRCAQAARRRHRYRSRCPAQADRFQCGAWVAHMRQCEVKASGARGSITRTGRHETLDPAAHSQRGYVYSAAGR